MPPAETPPPDLSSAFEDAVIGMTLAGVDHRLLRANRAFCEFLGLARDALLARPVDERVHPHDVPGHGRQRARLLAGEADRYRTEKRYIHADGRVLWADFSCALVRDAAGRPLHFISQVVDITHRKEAEEALRRSEAQLREATALIGIAAQMGRLGGWAYDVASGALSLSPEVRAMMDVRPGDPFPLSDAMHWVADADRPRVRALVTRALADGSPFDVEAQAVTARGRRLWVRILCEAEWDASGRVRRIYGASQDISEHKRAQLALQESQRTLSSLMSNLPGMAYRCLNQSAWPLEFVSEGAEQLTGYTTQQLLRGEPAYGDLVHPEDREQVWRQVQAGVDARRQFHLKYRLRTAAGDWKRVWEQGCGVFGEDGALRCLEGFVADITGMHMAQVEIARLNEGLEQRVEQRTRELQMANDELEALAYSIAHDLRAPMTALHGFSQLLQERVRDLDPRSAHYFGRIISNVAYMSDLTDALLSLARLSGVELQAQPVDIAELAREALRRLAELEPGRVVHAEIPDTLPAIGDASLLQRLMANLVGNAWKFSRPKPETFIRVGTEQLPDGTVAWFVQDHGVGFDMAHAGKLFGAFRRLHTSEFEGTGIGLALVRKIVARHGGQVWAQAEPGVGATVYFTLRAVPQAAQPG